MSELLTLKQKAYREWYQKNEEQEELRWIVKETGLGIAWMDCPNCNERWFPFGDNSLKSFKHCPSCGKKLKPPKEDGK